MLRPCPVFLLIGLFFALPCMAQRNVSGMVTDAQSHQGLPFATVKANHANKGEITDLHGMFTISLPSATDSLQITYLGYEPGSVAVAALLNGAGTIALHPAKGALAGVVIRPQADKIKRIMEAAIAHRGQHNPDKYDRYQCKVYYKMLVDAQFPDSLMNDTSKASRDLREFMTGQHLLLSETYSTRTWEQPQRLQEEVIAQRFSGLKKAYFTNLVTDVLPFHVNSDYIQLNGHDYHNPVSKGFAQRYRMSISDELYNGGDTIWLIHYTPKKGLNEMEGTAYIHSGDFAITHFIGSVRDSGLRRDVRIEQQYSYSSGRWFPQQLNYVIHWQQETNKVPWMLIMQGTSNIDSVQYQLPGHFHFNKLHTVQLAKNATDYSDSSWRPFRPQELTLKEQHTYVYMDSLFDHVHAETIINYFGKLLYGKFPIGAVDVNLGRLLAFNKWEGTRLGAGAQTNEKISPWWTIGGWAGYGFKDKAWKYGGFTELYLDRYKEGIIRLSYDNDIREPGRVNIDHDLDKNYLRVLLLQRADNVKSIAASIKERFNYVTAKVTVRQEKITPLYGYALLHDGQLYHNYTAREATLNLRYAFAERTAFAFDRYVSTGTRYPILYGVLTQGQLRDAGQTIPYTQALAAVTWQKHVNRIGNERFFIMGGGSWSKEPLPLSKLFAANGFEIDKTALYAFGGMLTMRPYDNYSERFVNAYWSHSFDWKLYRLLDNSEDGSDPYISIGYNYLLGSMRHPEAQEGVAFRVPDNGYHEAGLLLNELLRLRYQKAYYLTFNAGYFMHLHNNLSLHDDGRFVVGLGVAL